MLFATQNGNLIRKLTIMFFYLTVIWTPQTMAVEQRELVFYNWTAYVGKGIIELFEKTRNVRIR